MHTHAYPHAAESLICVHTTCNPMHTHYMHTHAAESLICVRTHILLGTT